MCSGEYWRKFADPAKHLSNLQFDVYSIPMRHTINETFDGILILSQFVYLVIWLYSIFFIFSLAICFDGFSEIKYFSTLDENLLKSIFYYNMSSISFKYVFCKFQRDQCRNKRKNETLTFPETQKERET